MTPQEYFELCTCPRRFDRGKCIGRDLDKGCPWHSLAVGDRLALATAPILEDFDDDAGDQEPDRPDPLEARMRSIRSMSSMTERVHFNLLLELLVEMGPDRFNAAVQRAEKWCEEHPIPARALVSVT
jgi:hypothetical protein